MKSIEREKEIAEAKLGGEAFAKARAEEMLKLFLCETQIVDDYFAQYDRPDVTNRLDAKDFLDRLTKDYIEPFTKIIEAAYSMGHMDQSDRIEAKIYRPKKEKIRPAGEPTQLILPGMQEE